MEIEIDKCPKIASVYQSLGLGFELDDESEPPDLPEDLSPFDSDFGAFASLAAFAPFLYESLR